MAVGTRARVATSDDALIAAARDSADAGIGWLEGLQHPDGRFEGTADDLVAYYKAPLAFAVTGRTAAGGRCCHHLTARFLSPGGELASGARKSAIRSFEHNLANYMNGWVAIGLWASSVLEPAERVVRQLQPYQSERHGGVLTGPAKWSGRARYDVATTASCGRAFLLTGHRDEAAAAGSFLTEVLRRQREPARWLDLCFDDRWTPVDADDPADHSFHRLDRTARGERLWLPALACGFLCELHQVTGDPSLVDAARSYFGVIEGLPEYREGTLGNGKTTWAAGSLARALGSTEREDGFARLVPNVLARQQHDGCFTESRARRPALPAEEAAPTPIDQARAIERTAEYTSWMAAYARLLAERSADTQRSADVRRTAGRSPGPSPGGGHGDG